MKCVCENAPVIIGAGVEWRWAVSEGEEINKIGLACGGRARHSLERRGAIRVEHAAAVATLFPAAVIIAALVPVINLDNEAHLS